MSVMRPTLCGTNVAAIKAKLKQDNKNRTEET